MFFLRERVWDFKRVNSCKKRRKYQAFMLFKMQKKLAHEKKENQVDSQKENSQKIEKGDIRVF